jgi:hypothetical protein
MWCRLKNETSDISNLICVENLNEIDENDNWLEFDDIEIASGYFNIPLYRYENLNYIDGKKVN